MNLADKLKPHVSAIQRDAANACPRAMEIINLYTMHRTSPADPAAPALCEAAFDEWRKSTPA